MHTTNVSFGPRLVANPTGALRAAVLVVPPTAIEEARPLPGEPSAVHARAVAEQSILIKTLEYFGCQVTLLHAHASDPYACAVVDATIVFENGAVMMRPSSMTRRPEVAWLEAEFEKRDIPIAAHISAPGLLDGSDVLMAGNTAFIGVSKRNNALGRGGFAQIAKAHGFNVVEVRLADTVLSLRGVAGVVASNAVVLGPAGQIDHAAFSGFKVHVTERDDQLGAGVLNLGDNHVLADIRFPKVINMLRKAGTTVEAIDLYDFGRVGMTPSTIVVDLRRA